MKKIYVLTVVCLCFAMVGMAQTYYWVGPANGLWSSAANWSNSSGGAGGAGVPNSAATNVIFNTASSLKLDFDVNLSTLTVTNNSKVRITATGGGFANRQLTVNSTVAATPGLLINAGSRLEDSTDLQTSFEFVFGNNGQGVIGGEWYLTGFDDDSYSLFTLPQGASQTTKVDVNNNASISTTTYGFAADNTDNAKPYLRFNSGSFLNLTGNGSFIPKATYSNTSTIVISGITDVGVVIDEKADLGNVIYNCPGQSLTQNMGLIGAINIDGDFQIQNTGGQDLVLMSNFGAAGNPVNATIKGDLSITGNSSVVVSQINTNDKIVNLNIFGNLSAGGNKFDIQSTTDNTMQPTNIFLKGNLQHTSGTFGASSASVNQGQALFVLEMNGTGSQTISSSTSTIDNINNQVTLRMNNAAGVTLLSPLSVGRIDFSGTNKGKLTTTSTNILTVQNTSGNNIVVNSPSSLGYVNGPMRRKSGSTSAMIIPTGAGGVYRQLTITPSSNAASTFEATLVSSGTPGAPLSPLNGLAPYYWNISRPSGSASATVLLTLVGAVPGAASSDALVVAKYDGANWSTAKGSTGTFIAPGTNTSGTVLSELQSSYNLFTIGYGLASALPINLVSFTGKKEGNSATLSWKITENSTPVNFEVLRSNDGKNFIKIGSAPVTNGKLNYSYSDNSLFAGNNYYRLKMFDQDGSISYSNIIVIMNGTKGVLISSMIPTVVRDRARLNISSSVKGNMQLVITDITGRIIQTQNAEIISGNQEVWLDAGKLSAGMFQVTGYINGERTATMRFIKQ